MKIEFKFLEEAKIVGYTDDNREEYQAAAVDEKGNKYLVTWIAIENWADLMDAGEIDDICNWSAPDYIELIEEAE